MRFVVLPILGFSIIQYSLRFILVRLAIYAHAKLGDYSHMVYFERLIDCMYSLLYKLHDAVNTYRLSRQLINKDIGRVHVFECQTV